MRLTNRIHIHGLIMGLIFGVSGASTYHYGVTNEIPKVKNVQADFAVPSRIEIKVEDVNDDSELETVLSYDRRKYLLGLDLQGNPVVKPYPDVIEKAN